MLRLAIYAVLIVTLLWTLSMIRTRFHVRAVNSDVIDKIGKNAVERIPMDSEPAAVATFGSGCFWCTEAIFESIPGVLRVTSGYSGGKISQPSYREVCSGVTGHAEVIQIQYNPSQIAYIDLLRAFWQSHDPTTLNRQGNDVGTQYRSVVFWHDTQQQQLAEFFKRELNEANAFGAPVLTEITKFDAFYSAEREHQDYFIQNPNKGYCRILIQPKLEKFKKIFSKTLPQKN